MSPVFSEKLVREVNFDNTDFITNSQLKIALGKTTASPAEVDAAVKLFADARLKALTATIMLLAALALLALIPAGGTPDLRKEELTVDDAETSQPRRKTSVRARRWRAP